MLLRVDKVSGGASPDRPLPSDDPLHVCLATGRRGVARVEPHKTGAILTAGRKNCLATFDNTCVSSAHATIALLSHRPLNEEAVAAARELLGGRAVMEYGAPSTPGEIRACESSPTGVVCVVRDRGSKFGTYVSVDEALLREHQDEGGASFCQLSEKQARAVELLAGEEANDAKFVRLDAHQSFPLLQLSHSTAASSPHVIILFGPQGSGIRLSLVPLCFTFSRVKKAELDPLLASLHYIGASHSAQWDLKRSTHLVAPVKVAAAKGVAAWASRRPVVTKGYIEALLGRNASDELPKEEEFTPSGSWDRTLKWTEEPSTALKGYRIAVMKDDDNGPLSASAGADVVQIHEDLMHGAQRKEWWEAQKTKALDDKLALVVVSSPSKKCKQFHEWLARDDGVRLTRSKHLALAITDNDGEGGLLLDTKKGVIEKLEGWDAEEGAKKSPPAQRSTFRFESGANMKRKEPPGWRRSQRLASKTAKREHADDGREERRRAIFAMPCAGPIRYVRRGLPVPDIFENSDCDPLPSTLSIGVIDHLGGEVLFKVSREQRTKKLKGLFQQYASRKGVALSSLSFMIQGKRISPDDSADSLGFRNVGHINVVRSTCTCEND